MVCIFNENNAFNYFTFRLLLRILAGSFSFSAVSPFKKLSDLETKMESVIINQYYSVGLHSLRFINWI